MKSPQRFIGILIISVFFVLLLSLPALAFSVETQKVPVPGNLSQDNRDSPSEVTITEDVTYTVPSNYAGWLSPEILISNPSILQDQEDPAIAYNSGQGEYMVAWYNNRPSTQDITVQRVSEQGTLLSYFFVSTAANCRHPDLAYSLTNGNYLVVWSQFYDDTTPADDDRWEIWGRIIDWNAPGSSSPFQIASWGNMNLEYPRVAYNSYRNHWLVVWQTSFKSSGQLTGIGRRLLDGTGSFLTGPGYITGEFPYNQRSPDLDYNLARDNYLVTWIDLGPTSYLNTYGAMLDHEGDLTGSVFAIDDLQQNFNHQRPAVTTNHGDGYMVLWDMFVISDMDILGRKVFINGSIDPPHYLVANWEDIDESAPAIAARKPDTGYLTAFQKGTPSGISIVAMRWGGASPFREVEIAPGAFGDNTDPAVAAGSTCYLVAYEWESYDPTYDKDIYARIFCPDAVLLPLVIR